MICLLSDGDELLDTACVPVNEANKEFKSLNLRYALAAGANQSAKFECNFNYIQPFMLYETVLAFAILTSPSPKCVVMNPQLEGFCWLRCCCSGQGENPVSLTLTGSDFATSIIIIIIII